MTLSFIQNIGGGSLVIILIYGLVWIYCLVDILRSDFKDPNMKIIWILIILFAQVIGSLIYLAMGKSTKASLYS